MRLTPGQRHLLTLLATRACTAGELAAACPRRSAEGLARTTASLAQLGAAIRHPAGPWAITSTGRAALAAVSTPRPRAASTTRHLPEVRTPMTTTPAAAAATRPAEDGPFHDREQAEAMFGRHRWPTASRLEALADTCDGLSGEQLGDYDRQVLGRLAALLDPVDVEVLCSLIRRAAHDHPDPSRYRVTFPHQRDARLAARL
jgi:hypothetical protein